MHAGGVSPLTPAERQVMIDSEFLPPASQYQAMMTAHPGMMESLGACIEGLGRPFQR